MPRFAWSIALGLSVLCGGVACGADGVLTLATTTSTENSGLLAYLHPDFERQTGLRVKVIAKGTGASLQLARDGNADVVLVHAPAEEEKFVGQRFGVLRRSVMYNDFVIIGPKNDPAGVGKAKDAVEALRRITAAKRAFISRGDGSGTHVKEQELWRRSGLPLQVKTVTMVVEGERQTFESVRPDGDWYFSIGQGMGKSITLATEKGAYTLADRGTFYALALAQPPKTDLVILREGDPSLRNPYSVIAVNPAKHPHADFAGAKQYIEWITSPRVQQMIGRYTIQGKVLFHPSAAAAGCR